ncbi:SAYSvFN domain-containing protein 1 [Pseudochaenichthys georgianus]|uniref:Uncharacterized protein n=1 Tax=Chaenocephalus aceratus TaxID=36190 RepID=A0ACB9VR07_CHAAC|nr:SAYSvFN domain-containing protein 1 [Pseudochaenichthys georgianus]XP_033932013.1 SAYSvFN domain-containing protein 1 [Pseudochaenichthys georgianus]KAI4802208.1 hypothetical protein KUCAC02_020060 [Chaenocephalus aceratus]
MEQKLADFRARRQAEHTIKKDEDTVKKGESASMKCSDQTEEDTAHLIDSTSDSEHTEEDENIKASTQIPPKKDHSDWLLDSAFGRWLTSRQLGLTNLTLLKVLLWLVLLGLFAELEFGLPFFVLSLFYWLYEGLRSPAAREPGELSAYSVFNPNCQPLMGTLTAEQLEGEMGYRALTNRAALVY